jgi:hypothetical protein
MNIEIFCRCSLFSSWSGQRLIITPVDLQKTQFVVRRRKEGLGRHNVFLLFSVY